MSKKSKWQEHLFGKDLIKCQNKSEEKDEAKNLTPCIDSLKGVDVIGVYFSFANINLKCDELKQKLKNIYSVINKGESGKRFEVVQVVLWANTDVYGDFEKGHRDCIKDVPWFAMRFDEMQLKERLSRRYRIKSGVTTLILLDSEGVTINRSAQDSLFQDPEGVLFPWKPRPLDQILSNVILHQGGTYDLDHSNSSKNNITFEDLPIGIRGLYFCANWCPPCRAFTPQLIEVYKKIRVKEPNFEIIFVSSDRSEESFMGLIETMPWLAIPWKHTNIRIELAQLYGVRGIPTLLLVDSSNKVITYDARQEIAEDPLVKKFPWKHSAVNILSERHIAKLYDNPAIILFIDGEETEIQFAESVLRPTAEDYYKSKNINLDSPDEDFLYGSSQESYLQFLIGIDSETADVIRDVTGIDDVVPLLVAVDIPNRKISVMEYGVEINEDSVAIFSQKFQKGELKSTYIAEKVEDKNESKSLDSR